MDLLNFPVPELEVTLKEVTRVLHLTLSPEQYVDYESALSKQKEVLQDAHHQLVAVASGQENWVTDQFKRRLLSCSEPLPTSTAVPAILPPSRYLKEGSQVERAAALLWAVAKLHSEPQLVEGDMPTERTQQSEVFSASRLPGNPMDQIKVYPDSLHAILICRGGIFPVQILSHTGLNAALAPLPFCDIYNQVSDAAGQPKASEQHNPTTICSFSALPRHNWHVLREKILSSTAAAKTSLELMESAVLALALEDCLPPANLADTLNTVRLGGGNECCLRYFDKVVNLVVFQDGTTGIVFEHSTVDGMVAALLADSMWNLSESLNFESLKLETKSNKSSSFKNEGPYVMQPLSFSLGPLKKDHLFTPCLHLQSAHPIMTFEIPSYPDVFTTLRAHRGLFDAWINFSLQLALTQTLGNSFKHHILVTPTHMRHYKHGRCDPTFSVTTQSRHLVEAFMCCTKTRNIKLPTDSTELQYTKYMFHLFHQAFQEHKHLIKKTKSGQGVGPHLAALRCGLSQDNPIKTFLDAFDCPSVYLTGKDLMEGMECAVGNVYAPNQLAVTYLGRRDRVRVVLNGKGSFAHVLGQLQENLANSLKMMMLLAMQYAIAGQMGAIECWLQKDDDAGKQETITAITGDFNTKGQHGASFNSFLDVKSDFTLLIHGGAGEDMMLNQKVTNMIEFSLQSALFLGAQILAGGGSSLDAVQRSVAALEDCFLFNAGKGSVFNSEGKHEMEATIVDGSRMNSGTVACVQKVKNPIKAARKVMEKSPHGLLVGEGAEAFLDSLEDQEKPVRAEYFHTDVRFKELEMKSHATKNNHPQTVGAVALDCWGKLAAAASTGGLVGKWKGRVGDIAVVGAGIFADGKVAVTCSGDGDLFLRQTVAHKVACLYHNKGYTLHEACKEVISENLQGTCAGIIAVDARGDTAIEINAGVMFVGSIIGGSVHAEVIKPTKNYSNVIWETDKLVAYLHSQPWTPGATILSQKIPNRPSSIFQLPEHEFLELLLGAKTVSNLLCEKLEVLRCALVYKPHPEQPAHIQVLPLHGLKPKWQPYLSDEKDFHHFDPGYCTSKNGPRWEETDLNNIQTRIRSQLSMPNAPADYRFLGEPTNNSLFSRIVRGEERQWRVWENSEHVAFLTPFPNAPGFTVLVPRQPLPSNILSLEEDDYKSLVLATREVAQLLQKGMGAYGVAIIFEGFETDYAHVKLIPLVLPPEKPSDKNPEFCPIYPGYVTSADGPSASPESLKEIYTKITQCRPPRSWENPELHAVVAIKSQWYFNLFQIQNTLFHSTVEYFHSVCRFSYALTPFTTDTISSPMGLGSDSEPVYVNLLGQGVYLADSMQFVLEYFLRFQEGLLGAYYVSPSFRGEDPDASHLNQFYHVECELLGNMDTAMHVAENYVAHLTRTMLQKHSDVILKSAGTLSHVQNLLKQLDEQKHVPRVTLEQAVPMMPSEDCLEWVQDGQPQYGRKLTRKGEQVLIERYGGCVWLMEMDHLAVPFYQAYVKGSGQQKAKAADLLLGLGETIGLGERHSTPEMVQEALKHHAVPEDSYKWYINMRQIKPLLTSGWGMGIERYLCWLLKHNDVRDMHIIPRMKAKKYMP